MLFYMKTACIVLGSGSGNRFSKHQSKLFYKINNHLLIEYTLKNISNAINKDCLYITIPKKINKKTKSILANYTNNSLILGGNSRYKSLSNALKYIDTAKYKYLMIHDAARPNISPILIKKLIRLITTNKYDAVIPALKITDSLKKNDKSVNRNSFKTTQTPQVFNINVFKKFITKSELQVTDDVQLIEGKKNKKIKYIDGNYENLKITKKEDVNIFKKYLSFKSKVGNGFDIHRLVKGNNISIGGLKIKSNYKAAGHSDGDVILHSLIDALLGAKAKGDIGTFFPPLKKYKDISSVVLLDMIRNKISSNNLIILNIDLTIICQNIRLEKHKKAIKKNLAKLLKCKVSLINIKGKTADNVGIFGKSEAIGCWATIQLMSL